MFPYDYEIFRSVGEAHCPQCDCDQLFSLLEESYSVSTTYHLVCNQCGYKTRISRSTARRYMPRQSVWQRHMVLIAWLAFYLAVVASGLIAAIQG